MIEKLEATGRQGLETLLSWLSTPAGYMQFALLLAAYLIALAVYAWARPRLRRVLDVGEEDKRPISHVLRFLRLFLPLLLPLIAYAVTAAGEAVTRSVFGAGEIIALGKRLFIFLAVWRLVKYVLKDPTLKFVGRYAALPIAALYVIGLLTVVTTELGEMRVVLGDINFSALAIIRGVIAGIILFWLGRWSSDTGTTYIRAQEELRPPTRELAAKAFEAAVFGAAFLLLINVLGLNLSALAIFGGALGVGIGFGLQKIASNFISGIILLLEGQATVGDFVELDGGESGTIVKLGARATILETFDGKWIVVPNEDFITSRIVNWSDAGSGNRYEVEFSVAYETDINTIPDLVEKAVSAHPAVLQAPEPPDCELRGFGDSGVDFAVEFWAEGLDDGPNKYTSDIRFVVWNALKDAGVEIPFPQREIRYRDAPAAAG
jgi:small-conductance mechanosensitive channel